MVKLANDLVPGDIVNLGAGVQMIVATFDLGDSLAVLCDCGQSVNLRYDCKLYVYCNRDCVIEAKRKQAEMECNDRERRNRELLQRAKLQAELEHSMGHTPTIKFVNGIAQYNE